MELRVICPCGQKDGWLAITAPAGTADEDLPANTEYYCGDCDTSYFVTDLQLELKP